MNLPSGSHLRYTGSGYARRDLQPLNTSVGIQGASDPNHVVNEIKRIHNREANDAARSIAFFAGLCTLLILGGCGYLLGSSIASALHLTRPTATASTTRKALNFVELVLFVICTLIAVISLVWVASRRATQQARIILVLTSIAIALQTAAAILNGVLIYAWSSQVKARCTTWKIDVVWWTDESDCTSGGTRELSGWLIAAGIRLIVVLVVGVIWLALIQRTATLRSLSGNRLATQTVTSLMESKAISQLLEAEGAKLVVLIEGDVEVSGAETQLPPMPQERVKVDGEPISEAQPSTLTWLVGNIKWLFGWPSSSAATEEDPHQSPSTPLLPMSERQESGFSFADNPLHPDHEPRFARPLPSLPPGASNGAQYRATLGSETPTSFLPTFPTFFKSHARTSSDQAASVPLVTDTSRRPSHDIAAPYDEAEYDSDQSDNGMEHLDESRQLPSHVFIQMSDGRLVRKLSTIRSEGTSEAARPDSADGSTPGRRSRAGSYHLL